MNRHPHVSIISAGLAGSEAALQLANAGITVRLHDMKPVKRSPAHHSNNFAEIVCSNSFGSLGLTASGLLKEELRLLNCQLLHIASHVAVPAGQALAVDREAFAEAVTEAVQAHPLIEFVAGDVTEIPSDTAYCLIATGPLTSEGLVKTIGTLTGQDQLYFFDAAAPIIVKDSINFDIAFYQDRYNKHQAAHEESQQATSEGSYINCPLTQEQYEALVQFMLDAEKTPLKSFEEAQKTLFFESCMPVEVIASRGKETLRFGPMKPVGIHNPHTNEQPYAVVQLRQDNASGTLYNLVGFQTNIKWGAQKQMIQMIPGLEEAEVVRYGVMHRNTFIHSPAVLRPTLQLTEHPHVFVAGQLTGTEGYTESIATGLWAAKNIQRLLQQQSPLTLPSDTMLGALLAYITRPEAKQHSFQPINSNWGILPLMLNEKGKKIKDKKEKARLHSERSLASLTQFIDSEGLLPSAPNRTHVPQEAPPTHATV
ncbi:MAG: methylenetetrahydrofolate--tRNA-(uracil(54)-C(5))-methyltransferase (FADH(2)-oxidizing) TrmFO [Vampirovibrionales bacterium]